MSELKEAAMAISIADIQAHPAEAMAALIETVRRQGEEISALKRDAKLDHQDIRDLFKAIEEIEGTSVQMKVKPSQTHDSRKEMLKGLLILNNGKMVSKDARHRMNLSESQFSQLLATVGDDIEVRPMNTNKRMNLLVMRSAKG